MRWEPTVFDHFLDLHPQDAQRMSHEEMLVFRDDADLRVHLPSVARTLLAEDVPIGILGVWGDGDGRAVAFAVFAKEGLRHGIRISRGAHRFLAEVAARDSLRRIEATIDPAHDAALVFAHRMGFVREGLMEAYFPDGRPAWRVARTRF